MTFWVTPTQPAPDLVKARHRLLDLGLSRRRGSTTGRTAMRQNADKCDLPGGAPLDQWISIPIFSRYLFIASQSSVTSGCDFDN